MLQNEGKIYKHPYKANPETCKAICISGACQSILTPAWAVMLA